MQLPIQQLILDLPPSPYLHADKGFLWRETSAGSGQGANSDLCHPAEAVKRLRALANYIEENAK